VLVQGLRGASGGAPEFLMIKMTILKVVFLSYKKNNVKMRSFFKRKGPLGCFGNSLGRLWSQCFSRERSSEQERSLVFFLSPSSRRGYGSSTSLPDPGPQPALSHGHH